MNPYRFLADKLGLTLGAASAAAASALTIGMAPGGIALAAGGGAVGALTRDAADAGGDFLQRALSIRERDRTSQLIRLAADAFDDWVSEGGSVRNDGFFDDQPNGRSAAKELIEGFCITAAKTYEERKLPFIANFMVAIGFLPDISQSIANHLLNTVERLTWTDFVIIAAIGRADQIRPPDVAIEAIPKDWGSWDVTHRLNTLRDEGFFGAIPEKTARLSFLKPDLRIAYQKLASHGTLLYQLLGLEKVSDDDVRELWSRINVVMPDEYRNLEGLVSSRQVFEGEPIS